MHRIYQFGPSKIAEEGFIHERLDSNAFGLPVEPSKLYVWARAEYWFEENCEDIIRPYFQILKQYPVDEPVTMKNPFEGGKKNYDGNFIAQ